MPSPASSTPDRVIVRHERGRTRIVFEAPHGNALTDAMVGVMRDAIESVPAGTKLVTFEGGGAHFCFGSSLEEHVPERMATVLPRFHALVRAMIETPAVTAAIVHGRCLGGGFELALACDLIFASDEARFGLPEVKVGAFPPVGSILLPCRVGASRAAHAILTGCEEPAAYWRDAGLLECVVPQTDLIAAGDDWFDVNLVRATATVLRHTAPASRTVIRAAIHDRLPDVERRYLRDLAATADAAEGVQAFLERRRPQWHDE